MPGACAAFLAIVDEAASSDPAAGVAICAAPKGVQAYGRFMRTVEWATREELTAVAAALSEAEQLKTAEATFVLCKFYTVWAQRNWEQAPEEVARIKRKAVDAAFLCIRRYPNHELSRDVIDPLLDLSDSIGAEEGAAAVERLKKHLQSAPPSFATYNCWYRLVERAQKRGEQEDAKKYCARMLQDREKGVLEEALKNASVRPKVKVRVEYSLGVALDTVGKTDEALAQYRRVQSEYAALNRSGDGPVNWAAFGETKIKALSHGADRNAAMAEYQAFIERWPDSPNARKALLSMADLHDAAGNRAAALECLTRVVQEDRTTPEAKLAQEQLDKWKSAAP